MIHIVKPDTKPAVPYRVDRYFIDGRGFEIFQRTRIFLTDTGAPAPVFFVESVNGIKTTPSPDDAPTLTKFFSIAARLCDFGQGPVPQQYSFDIPEETLGAAIEKWEHYSNLGWDIEEKRIRAELSKFRIAKR